VDDGGLNETPQKPIAEFLCPQLRRLITETCRPPWARQRPPLLSCCDPPKAEGHLSGEKIIPNVHITFLFMRSMAFLRCASALCVQYIPGGDWRGDCEESKERVGASGVFPIAHVARRGAGPGHSTLLHSRAATQQPPRGQSLHCGRQSHLQRLLEQPFGPTQKLPCLLPGYEQLSRGEWLLTPTSCAADLAALHVHSSVQNNEWVLLMSICIY